MVKCEFIRFIAHFFRTFLAKISESTKYEFVLSISHRPDTATFVQRLEREREARDTGEVKDQRGFFAKYWMYIVPVAILVLISGSAGPDGGNGGGR